MSARRNLLRLFIVCVIAVTLLPSCSVHKLFPRTVEVPATVEWFESGVDVDDGDELLITADGLVSLNPNVSAVGPDGTAEFGTPNEYDLANGTDTAGDYPMPDELIGALVAKVGLSGDVFLVGSESAFTASVAGEIYFSVNDRPVDNNDGFFTVRIDFLGPLF